MALTLNERSPTQLQIIKDAVNAAIANLWTCLPCEVLEYDTDAVTVNVQPLIKIPVYLPDGEIETVELPMLLDVPVMFHAQVASQSHTRFKKVMSVLLILRIGILICGGNRAVFKTHSTHESMTYPTALHFLDRSHKQKRLAASPQLILRFATTAIHAKFKSSLMVRFTLLALSPCFTILLRCSRRYL